MSGRAGMSTAELDRALVDLGAAFEYPATPDLATRVVVQLERGGERGRQPRGWLRPATVALAVAAMAALILVVSPGARSAVAELLDIVGIDIRIDDVDVTPPPDPSTSPGAVADRLRLGEQVTLDTAVAEAPFLVSIPRDDALGPPDEVYLDPTVGGGQVALVYAAEDGLPGSTITGVGVLIGQFGAPLADDYIEKVIPDARDVQSTTVDGHRALWVQGGHALRYVDADGRVIEESLRLADNTLLWEEHGVTIRLESALDLERAVAIAESMGPSGD